MPILQYITIGSILGLVLVFILESIEKNERVNRKLSKIEADEELKGTINSQIRSIEISRAIKNSDEGKLIVLQRTLLKRIYTLNDLKKLNTDVQKLYSNLYDSGTVFKTNYPEDSYLLLSRKQFLNVSLFLNETIANSAHHAQPSFILNLVTIEDNYLEIITHDNGKGFNLSENISTSGLKDLYRYAENLNAALHISALTSIGTKITMRLKI